MQTFQYKAATTNGSIVDGTMSGSSREHVITQLQSLGQIPIRVDVTGGRDTDNRRSRFGLQALRKKKVADQQIADSTRDLATLLRAGVPLDRALGVMISLAEGSPMASLLDDIRQRVKQGASLADAMEKQDNVFSRFYINLLRAGESSGTLELVLERLAEQMESSKEVRDELTSALIYPAILVFVAITSILILLTYVVPQFTEMFEGVGQVLPLSTRITIGVGEALQEYGWLLIVATVGTIWIIRRQLQSEDGAYKWHKRMLGLPIAGPIIVKMEVARFARTLSILLHNGIPLLKALSIVKETMSNKVLAAGIERAAGRLREGQSLAKPLAELTDFPPFAIHMIGVGEQTGNLQEILMQVADTFDRDTRTTIKRALTLLEPMLILVLGVIIAAVIISILVAILSVNDLVI
jgi:general secretion pathway protein F